MDLKNVLRNIPDFPKPGINFIDITTLLLDPEAVKYSINKLTEPYKDQNIDKVVGIESRGFIFGVPVSMNLDAGFALMRKPGKLPADTYSHTYELEYGTDTIEIHKDAIQPGDNVVVIDDLLATGGTAVAAIELLKKFDCNVKGISFVIELAFLNARPKFGDVPVHSLVTYED